MSSFYLEGVPCQLADGLLARVAAGEGVAGEQLDELARGVLQHPLVLGAAAVLEAQGPFKLARAIDLAAMICAEESGSASRPLALKA